MIEKGLVYGRFQILHLKHVEYILAAKMRCKRLYIGITVSDDLHVAPNEEENYRVRRSANPLTYIERYEMIRDTLLSFGVPREEFEIIPFPIDRVEYLRQYLPDGATCFMSICDEWTRQNEKRFEKLEIPVEVLWRRTDEEKGVSGSQIRQRILADEKWEDLVPKTVYDYVLSHRIDDRIKFSK